MMTAVQHRRLHASPLHLFIACLAVHVVADQSGQLPLAVSAGANSANETSTTTLRKYHSSNMLKAANVTTYYFDGGDTEQTLLTTEDTAKHNEHTTEDTAKHNEHTTEHTAKHNEHTAEEDGTFMSRRSSSVTTCQRMSGGTCYVFGCSSWRGPTDCISRQCVCKPGYCADADGICRGCGHLSVEVKNVKLQSDKAGYYSAVTGFFFANRPVWKQFHGNNWLWYCRQHACWVVSSLMPNEVKCEAGIVSPLTEYSVTPFQLGGDWKIWSGEQWLDDEKDQFFGCRCQDKNHFESGDSTSTSYSSSTAKINIPSKVIFQ